MNPNPNKIPYFFKDESNNLDHEIMLDYFLGWTLRCSQESNQSAPLKEASKKVMAYLLKLNPEEFTVKNVLTWKQSRQIDLWVEASISMKNDSEERHYALLIENKMYTHLHNNQLERYKEIFEGYYKDKPEFKQKHIVLSCFHNECDCNIDLIECNAKSFDFYSFGWLKSESGLTDETGNYLFDEFWFRYW